MKFSAFLFSLFLVSMYGCIGDDFVLDEVDPILRIENGVDTLAVGDSYQFQSRFLNNVGAEETVDVDWTSSAPTIVSIDNSGLAQGISPGSATITATTVYEGSTLTQETNLTIGENTIIIEQPSSRTGTIRTTSSYTLRGDFTLSEDNGSVVLDIADNYSASTALPGLYIYLTNNPATTSGALEIGRVTTFSGSHSYTLPAGTGINDYGHILYFCKPFNVKVGDGQISE